MPSAASARRILANWTERELPMKALPTRADAPASARVVRCWWAGDDPLYIDYHDREWGFPVGDDRRLFEKICLEGFQAGLSWRTILGKREAFRAAFAGFDFTRIARFTARDVERLLGDDGIVRHRGKIESVRNNARRASEVVREFGSLAAYFWRFEPPRESRPRRLTRDVLAAMTTSAEAIALSKDLKRRGFTFVGPTTVYAFMQAMGLVNDHVDRCVVRAAAQKARAAFERPRASAVDPA
jgi:DNA-3-methyladenine glycosylase I